jgi:hypothetical protein
LIHLFTCPPELKNHTSNLWALATRSPRHPFLGLVTSQKPEFRTIKLVRILKHSEHLKRLKTDEKRLKIDLKKMNASRASANVLSVSLRTRSDETIKIAFVCLSLRTVKKPSEKIPELIFYSRLFPARHDARHSRDISGTVSVSCRYVRIS